MAVHCSCSWQLLGIFCRCSKKAEGEWLLVQAFCYCHELAPSSAFLKECAEQGQWLPLLCHAQLYSISLQEVTLACWHNMRVGCFANIYLLWVMTFKHISLSLSLSSLVLALIRWWVLWTSTSQIHLFRSIFVLPFLPWIPVCLQYPTVPQITNEEALMLACGESFLLLNHSRGKARRIW